MATGIAGRVVAADTQLPLAGVVVNARKLDECGVPSDQVFNSTTGADGSYQRELAEGEYRVEFDPLQIAGGDPYPYMIQYFSGRSWPPAQTTTVISGALASGVDAALHRGGRIAGRITAGSSNYPMWNVDVVFYARDDGRWIYAGATAVDGSGYYTSTPLRAGIYTALASPRNETWWNALSTFYGGIVTDINQATTFTVAPAAITSGIDIVPKVGGVVTGIVEPIAGVWVGLYPADREAIPQVNGPWGSAITNADGSYRTTPVPPGDYVVRFGTPTFRYPMMGFGHQFYDNQTLQSHANVVHLAAGQFITGVNARLPSGGMMYGRLRYADTGEGAITSVDIYDSEGSRVQRVTSTRDGWAAYDLAPGGYKVRFNATQRTVGCAKLSYMGAWAGGGVSFAEAPLFQVPGAGQIPDHVLTLGVFVPVVARR